MANIVYVSHHIIIVAQVQVHEGENGLFQWGGATVSRGLNARVTHDKSNKATSSHKKKILHSLYTFFLLEQTHCSNPSVTPTNTSDATRWCASRIDPTSGHDRLTGSRIGSLCCCGIIKRVTVRSSRSAFSQQSVSCCCCYYFFLCVKNHCLCVCEKMFNCWINSCLLNYLYIIMMMYKEYNY